MKALHFATLAALAAFGALTIAHEALAVVGMPATPLSYAGVARRTTRRVAYAAGAAEGAAAANAAAAQKTVTVLPAGCAEVIQDGVAYQKCGATYYRPYYQGPNLVYVVGAP